MSDEKHVRKNEAMDAESVTANADDDGGDPRGNSGDETNGMNISMDTDVPAYSQDEETAEISQEDRMDQLEAEVAELTDSLLRKTADFDNYRKRMLREKEDFLAYANRELLLDIVGIIDDFERAIRSADESNDFAAFHDGIVMIEKQFTSMLERKWKLVRFDSVGQEFDPQKHEAMMTEESAEHDEATVVEDFQKGYMLHEKVLRPSKVKVAMPAGDAGGQENE